MKLIVGLGNPGLQYEKTRHNVGFMAMDILATKHAPGVPARARFHSASVEAPLPGPAGEERCMLLKPTTFMNRSGLAVADAIRFYKLDPACDLFVIVDDIYLPCGGLRVRADGSAAGHNGLADIERALGTHVYPRCRIGVDAPGIIPQADYVLGRFTDDQWPLARQAIQRAAEAAEVFVRSGLNTCMNRFNAKPGPAERAASRKPAPSTPASNAISTPASNATSTPQAPVSPGPSDHASRPNTSSERQSE